MKVSTSEVPPRQVVLEIEVEPQRMAQAMDQAYQRIASRVNVPGFRKGRAPRPLIERMVGRHSIVEDAVEHLTPTVVREAIDQEKLEPYSNPRVELLDLEPLRVKATVPLSPRVELGPYQAEVRVPASGVAIEPSQIDEVVERLRDSYAQWVPVERPARAGDRVGISVRGQVRETGRVLLDSKDAEYVVDPDGAQPAPGFANEVIGLSAGEQKQVTLTLPDDYRETDLRGSPVIFDIEMQWVKEKQLPEADDAFAQQVGDYANVAALRTAVESQLRERETERIRNETQQAALDKLVDVSTIEVAPQVIEHQATHITETFADSLSRQGISLDQYFRITGTNEGEFRQQMQQEAEKRVKRSLALDAFAEAEKIEVDEAQVEQEAAAAATALGGQPTNRIEEAQRRVRDALREQKALERLIELATQADSSRRQKGASKSSGGAGKKKLPKADTGSHTQEQPASPSGEAAAGEADVDKEREG